MIAELERRINALTDVPQGDHRAARELVSTYDPRPAYYAQISRMVELDAIKDSGLRVVHECMYGSGYGYIAELIGSGRTTVTELHNQRNPLFGGISPEPIRPNIDSALSFMKVGGQDLCICTDGDADRVGIIDETGTFINQLQVFALLMLYLFEVRGMRGPVIKTVNMTAMVDKLGADFGAKVFQGATELSVHNHLFPAANTGIAFLRNKPNVLEAEQKFLKGVLRVDVFGIHEGGEIDGSLIAPLRPEVPAHLERILMGASSTDSAKRQAAGASHRSPRNARCWRAANRASSTGIPFTPEAIEV